MGYKEAITLAKLIKKHDKKGRYSRIPLKSLAKLERKRINKLLAEIKK